MVIKPEELNYLQERRKLKVEYVFLEKADQPSTRTGEGVTEGILMLTDNQLAFFSVMKGKSSVLRRLSKVGIRIATHMAGEFTFGLAHLAEYGIEKGIDYLKNEHIDLILSAQADDSFVVSLQKVISCEKFGGRLSLSPKKRFVRIGILDEHGRTTNYCVYSVNPKNTELGIHYEKWFDIINEVTKTSSLTLAS